MEFMCQPPINFKMHFLKNDSTKGRNQLSAGTIEKMDAAYESLILGDIVPVADFSGIMPKDFTWK